MTASRFQKQQLSALLRLLRVVERNPRRLKALEQYIPIDGVTTGTRSDGVPGVALGSVGPWLCRRGLAERLGRVATTERPGEPAHLYFTLTEKGVHTARQVFDEYLAIQLRHVAENRIVSRVRQMEEEDGEIQRNGETGGASRGV